MDAFQWRVYRDGEEENNGDNDSDSNSDGNGKRGQRGQDDNMKKPRKIQFLTEEAP